MPLTEQEVETYIYWHNYAADETSGYSADRDLRAINAWPAILAIREVIFRKYKAVYRTEGVVTFEMIREIFLNASSVLTYDEQQDAFNVMCWIKDAIEQEFLEIDHYEKEKKEAKLMDQLFQRANIIFNCLQT